MKLPRICSSNSSVTKDCDGYEEQLEHHSNECFQLSQKRIILAQESMEENNIDVIILFDGNQTSSKFVGTTAPFGALLIFRNLDPLIIAPPIFEEQAGGNIDTEVMHFEGDLLSTLGKAIALRIGHKKRLKIGFDSFSLGYSVGLVLQRIGYKLADVSSTVLTDSLKKPFPEELKYVREISRICDCGLEAAYGALALGIRECEVAGEADRAMWRAGATRFRFPSLVCSGTKSSFPHSTTARKIINEGETIIVDISPMFLSYDGDVARSFLLGDDKKWAQYYQILQDSLLEALSIVMEGTNASEVDSRLREILTRTGLPSHPHLTGHPIGGFRSPFIGTNSRDILDENMVFVIEPGTYLKGTGGIRIERHVLVKKNGFEILDRFNPNFQKITG